MLKAYKYRLYPNQEQSHHLIRAMGSVRYLYNKALEFKTSHYQQTGKNLTYFDLQNSFLIEQKKLNEWLKEPSSQSLQMALRNLDNAFTNFFHKKSKYPKFKSKHNNHHSVQYPQSIRVDWKSNRVYIPKCGEVFVVFDRKFEGKIKTCTISKTPTNKFFISILVENNKPLPSKQEITEETSIGIDLGIKNFAVLSDGQVFNNPKYLRITLNKLKAYQRKLSKKQKGSKNRNKARIKLAKIFEKLFNQRNDFLHKLSSLIINSDNQTIILENLAIGNMLKNHHLALSISDCGWGMFNNMLEYKAEWNGKNIIYIGRFEPSSKMCSNCGNINKELTLDIREWDCQNCHTHLNRDVNAAINIKKFGLHSVKNKSISGQELSEEPVKISESMESTKQETLVFMQG